MYKKQEDAMFNPARISCIAASSKSGKTVSAVCWLAEQAMMSKIPGRNFWWVAPIFPQAEIAFRRMSRGIPENLRRTNKTNLTITLPNESVMWFKSGENPDSLYGEDVYAAVMDEASRVRHESFIALRSTLTATRGPLRLIGNVKGRKNWFYQLCMKAQAGEPGMAYYKLTCWDAIEAGVLTREEIESARRVLPEAVFKELYEAEPSAEGGNPFGLSAIDKIWMPEMSTESPVALGVDLAKSLDWTWITGLDSEGRLCLSERWQGPWNMTKARLIPMIGDLPCLMDSTGVGDPIVEDLQKDCPNIEGFKFTAQSKQQLMEGLASDIHQQNLRLAGDILKNEFDSFEYEFTRTGVRYSAPPGQNDDGVMSVALANSRKKTMSLGMLSAF